VCFFGGIVGILMGVYWRNMGIGQCMMQEVIWGLVFHLLLEMYSGIGQLQDRKALFRFKVGFLRFLYAKLINRSGVQKKGLILVLKHGNSIIPWFNLVWFPMAIPSHSFMLLLVFRGAIVTKVKMSGWGYGRDTLCRFYYGKQESLEHFFSCNFSRRVWRAVMADCMINPAIEWEEVERWSVSSLTGGSLWVNLCKLCLAASVYHLWKLRNDLCHCNTPRTEEAVVKQMKWEVRTRIMAKGKFKLSRQNANLVQM